MRKENLKISFFFENFGEATCPVCHLPGYASASKKYDFKSDDFDKFPNWQNIDISSTHTIHN